jgi:hypothetical protein
MEPLEPGLWRVTPAGLLRLILPFPLLFSLVLQAPAGALPVGGDPRLACAPAGQRRAAPLPATLVAPASAGSRPTAGGTYVERLASTALGWPRLDRWCVWVEPTAAEGPGAQWERRWLEAVEAALVRWGQVLPLERVNDPEAAQVRILRRRPPLRHGPDGRLRASHGRALLQLQTVEREGIWRLEPLVEVWLSPGQRTPALQATALHELGHAFGLWGHSDDPADAMAAVPGADPVTELSGRDRATVRWLYDQPTRFGRPVSAPGP